jgi:hypothetical protein
MGYQSIMSLPYLAPHIQGIDINYPWDPNSPPILSNGHWIFVFLSNHEQDLNAVRVQYPGGELREVTRRYPSKGVLYWSYEINLQ